MKKLILVAALSCIAWAPAFDAAQARQAPATGNISAWEKQAQNVTIIRDDWGIPHVYGKTDADAVFGVMYAQAEDDFNRVETNYLNAMGRLAEAEGESAIYRDLRMKLFIDPDDAEEAVRRESRVAEVAHERMGGRAQLLSAHASRSEAARDQALRAVDGAVVQRGHRSAGTSRRSRFPVCERSTRRDPVPASWRPPSRLRRFGGTSRRGRSPCRRTRRVKWDRARSVRDAERARDAAHQSAHVLLLPRRSADGQRGRAERVRRAHVGPVLHLPGLQRQGRLDAHLQQRGQHRRVPRDDRREERQALLQGRRTKSGRSSTSRSSSRSRPPTAA